MNEQFEEMLEKVCVYGKPITKNHSISPTMIDLIIIRQRLEIQHILKREGFEHVF